MLLIYIPGYGCYSARQWWDTDALRLRRDS
nr:MAG TPA: hypothetical protein [Caudoviricetes sp.]